MLLIVGIEVVKRKTIMAGEKIHAGIVPGVIVIVVGIETAVQVSGAGYTPGSIPGMPEISLQIGTKGIPVAPVPFRPTLAGGEFSHLVQAARVPCLCDQLYIAQHGVGGQKLQERRIVQGRTVLMPPQDAGKVKAEAVDPVAYRPVPQAFQDHLAHDGVVAVQGIAAAAEIIVIPVGRQHIIDLIVEALETEGRTLFVALCGMVEHNVKDDLDAVVVEGLDQDFQLGAFLVVFIVCDVTGIGGEEAYRIIAPVVQEILAVHSACVHGLVKFEDGHQLHRINAKLFQIGNLFHQACEGAPVLYT